MPHTDIQPKSKISTVSLSIDQDIEQESETKPKFDRPAHLYLNQSENLDLSIDLDDLARMTNQNAFLNRSESETFQVEKKPRRHLKKLKRESEKSKGLVADHPIGEDQFADMVNEMSIIDSFGELEETLKPDMKSLFDQSESKPREESSAQILLVDNNIFFTMHILNKLKVQGLNCDHAQDGQEAMQMIGSRFVRE